MTDDDALEARWAASDAYPFSVEVSTRWGDLDMFSHLNNVAIAQIHEDARARFIATLQARLAGDTPMVRRVVAEVRIRYLAEGRYPDPLLLGGRISRIGRSSYRMVTAMFQNDVFIGDCETTFVHVDGSASVPIPPAWRRALESFSDDA